MKKMKQDTMSVQIRGMGRDFSCIIKGRLTDFKLSHKQQERTSHETTQIRTMKTENEQEPRLWNRNRFVIQRLQHSMSGAEGGSSSLPSHSKQLELYSKDKQWKAILCPECFKQEDIKLDLYFNKITLGVHGE